MREATPSLCAPFRSRHGFNLAPVWATTSSRPCQRSVRPGRLCSRPRHTCSEESAQAETCGLDRGTGKLLDPPSVTSGDFARREPGPDARIPRRPLFRALPGATRPLVSQGVLADSPAGDPFAQLLQSQHGHGKRQKKKPHPGRKGGCSQGGVAPRRVVGQKDQCDLEHDTPENQRVAGEAGRKDRYPSKEALDAAGTGAADVMNETFEQLDELLVTLGASVGRS
jgi:hypothetical protein